jgi:hypothetical protein
MVCCLLKEDEDHRFALLGGGGKEYGPREDRNQED